MKKIFFGVFLTLVCLESGFADCSDNSWEKWEPGRAPNRDDYIWRNSREYNDALAKDGKADAMICGGMQKHTCWNGDEIVVPAEHVFKGEVVLEKVRYVCRAGGRLNHHWEPIKESANCETFRWEGTNVTLKKGQNFPLDVSQTMTPEECSKIIGQEVPKNQFYQVLCNDKLQLECIPVKSNKKDACTATIKGKNVELEDGKEYNVDLSSDNCQKAGLKIQKGTQYDPNAIYHFYCGPSCKFVRCNNGYTQNSNGVCVKKDQNSNPGKKSCRDSHKKDGAERLACCDVEDAKTGWWQDGACHCNNKSATFKVLENGTGWCEVKSGDNQQTEPEQPKKKDCPSDARPSDDNKTCICDDKTNMKYNENKKICECVVPGTKKVEGECKCEEKEKELKNGKCDWSEAYLATIKIEIDKYYSKLTEIGASFKVSEWRDAEGEFNTARLASDSIAGVVLGTVGGVVTSHLVKKAQVKQGFEDIQCHIGGQSVASFGDEFVVGR